MSIHCPSSPTYHTSVEQKLRSRNAARQFKFGSPKLRDMLREKCRVRVREARRASFDSNRNKGGVGTNSLVSKILRQELADLEADLNIQEHIFKELIGEMNMWYVDQLEEEEKYLIEVGDSDIVFCPVCQKAALEQTIEHKMFCQCGVSFNFKGSLEQLFATIQKIVSEHEAKCDNLLDFFVEENSSGNQKCLNMMCENCDYFVTLT